MAKKTEIALEDLQDLVKLASYPEWKTFLRLLNNRKSRDRQLIIDCPSDSSKLPTTHAFYKGRISAVDTMEREVNGAADLLEKLTEKAG